MLDQLAERNVYVDGEAREAWFVDSETLTATRLTLPEEAAARAVRRETTRGGGHAHHPDSLLDDALARLDETTEVTVGTDARVAGREVYELILEPRTDDTLIGEIRFAIDGENGVALAASVTARGADDPAFEVAFSRVSFAGPGRLRLRVHAPRRLPSGRRGAAAAERRGVGAGTRLKGHPGDATGPAVYGEGWSAVVELSGADAGGGVLSQLDPDELGMLQRVTTPPSTEGECCRCRSSAC